MKVKLFTATILLGIFFVIERSFAEEMDVELNKIAERLVAQIKESGKKKVTVLDFTDLQGQPNEVGRFIAEQISVSLVELRSGFSIMDRANLKTILSEHKLTVDGLVNPENAKKLGQFSGVDAIILGNITLLQTEVAITTKMIATDTAEILGAAKGRVTRTKDIDHLIERVTVATKTTASENGDQSQNPPKLAVERNARQIGNLYFKVESLKMPPTTSPSFYSTSLTLIVANLSKTDTIGLALEQDTYEKTTVSNSRGDVFKTVELVGITTAYGNNGRYSGEFTDIPPGGSISISITSQFLTHNKFSDYRPYRFQSSIIFGVESQGRYNNIKKQNILIDID